MRHTTKPGKDRANLISANEIACWAYCPEAWRMEYGLGLDSGNKNEKMAGNCHHAWKSVAERVAGGTIALGRFLAALAVLGLLLLLWWWL